MSVSRAVIVERKRLDRLLTACARRRVTLLAAPAGYGKSVALDSYLRCVSGDVVRLNVRRSQGSLARFARALAAAFAPSIPAIGQSLAIAHERATQSPRPSDVLAAWLAEHLEGVARTIVIDDLQNGASDPGIAAFVAGAIDRTGANVRWILATHATVDLPLAAWLARGDTTVPIDERALRLTVDEASSLAKSLAPALELRRVVRLCESTEGAPSVVAFALQTLAQDPLEAARLVDGGGDAFDRFAEHVFARFTPLERAHLVESATFPDLDEALVPGIAGESSWVARVIARAPQLVDVADGRAHYHGLFFGWLRERLARRGSVAVAAATLRAANALERTGRIDEALALHVRERHHAELVRLIEAHGFEFVEDGRGESIQEAIDALDPLAQMSSAAVLAIKAVWESRSGRFDTAESWFDLALARSSAIPLPRIAYEYGAHLLRFFRPEAVDVFEQLAEGVDASDLLRAYALAGLGAAYVFARRLSDARRASDESLVIAIGLGDPHLIAKSHVQASFVALYAGEAVRAKRLASDALSLSSELGFFEVAAGALCVLHNIASEIEDDPAESLHLLEALGDCAAKSGSLTDQVIALVASLEIEIERNNERVAERLDRKLQTLDVGLAGRATYEALLPAQAMRATWTADFARAYRLLEGSSSAYWSADRRALRLAEIAAYAAAAGFEREASDAMHATSEVLARCAGVDLRAQRARLMLALAAIVLGRSETAAQTLEHVGRSREMLSPRLLALHRTLGALLERYRGTRNHDGLMKCLAEMDDVGFAGLARTISMLPLGRNASHRAGLLTQTERAVLLRFAGKKERASAHGHSEFAGKIGSVDGDAR